MSEKYRDQLFHAAIEFRVGRISASRMREIIDEVLQVYIEAEDALKVELNRFMLQPGDGGFVSGITESPRRGHP